MSSPADATESMIRNLEAKTGRPMAEWLDLAKRSGLDKHGAIVKHLKAEHGLTHGYANLVALKSLESAQPAGAGGGTDLVAAQYAGARAALRPIYDALISAVRTFGPDVEIAPKKTYVSLRRNKQFAIVQPGTATRIDLGLNLKSAEPTARLEPSGSFNSMVSHRIRITSPADVDPELLTLLRTAYDSA